MKNEPVLHLLHSIIVGLMLYLVFKFVMLFNEHLAQVSAIIVAAFCCLYLVIVYEVKDIVKGNSSIIKN